MQYLALVSFNNKCVLSKSRNHITTSLAITVKQQYIKGFVHSKRLSQMTLTQQPSSDCMIISLATAICRHASSFLCFSEARGNISASLLTAANFSFTCLLKRGKCSFAAS